MNKREEQRQQGGYDFAKFNHEQGDKIKTLEKLARGTTGPDSFDKGIIKYCNEARRNQANEN